jgi:hypothetical protein
VGVLSDAALAAYDRDGVVLLEEAFPRDVAERCCAHLWSQLRQRPDDPSTWSEPSVRLMDHSGPAFAEAVRSERWATAIAEAYGPDATIDSRIAGTSVIRFPVDAEPVDAGWHIDASYVGPDGWFWTNHRSRDRAGLMLVLLTDTGPDDAPTRIRLGSHHLMAGVLEPFGEDGVSGLHVPLPEELDDLPVALATGRAGDVYLCHPFLVHAAQAHRGVAPRILAQPPVPWRPGVTGFDDATPPTRRTTLRTTDDAV